MGKTTKTEYLSGKGGMKGDRMWRTHRLEGVVKNRAIKPKKKGKKSV
jgi:hypothetical protein